MFTLYYLQPAINLLTSLSASLIVPLKLNTDFTGLNIIILS
jgi:hypothetical protein